MIMYAAAMEEVDRVAEDKGLKESLGRYAIESGAIMEQVYRKKMEVPIEDRQLFHQLRIASSAADAVQTAQPRQNGLHLRSGKHCAVHAVVLHDGNAAARALGSSNGNIRPAQRFDIPLDGSAGHFKLRRQLRSGDLFLLEQNG